MPTCFAQCHQHFGPDIFMMFLIFCEAIGPDPELKTYAFHNIVPMINQIVTSAISKLKADSRSDIFSSYLLRYSLVLPIGVVDVVFVPNEWQAEQDIETKIRIILNCIFAKFASLEFVTSHTLDLASGKSVHRINGKVAQVGRIPKRKLRSSAILDVFTHLIRGTKTRDKYFTNQLRICDSACRSSNTDGGGRNDHLEVGILGKQSLSLVITLGIVIIAIYNFIQFQFGVFRLLEFCLHHFDPGILIRGSGCST